MNQPSLFSRIIKGEIPAHKIYEDQRTLAFLDIHPVQPGHALIVTKTEADRLEDLGDEDYAALMDSTRKVMRRLRQVLGCERVCLKVEGFDVPHVHVHAIPCQRAADFWNRPDEGEPDHAALAAMADRLRF
ncbi:MAG: HIT family protein [Candidatus Chaera renei]|uniref:HIT family protein n=1 Tax=Candidatus Chaera renei TaxID=2506947 RepID=A0A4Q0AIT2_9BACT|nr:MAG: HIT family protein [Candidatus Chaera renei]